MAKAGCGLARKAMLCCAPGFWCAGQLLDHIGGNINPLRVIQKIPEGLAIDKLR